MHTWTSKRFLVFNQQTDSLCFCSVVLRGLYGYLSVGVQKGRSCQIYLEVLVDFILKSIPWLFSVPYQHALRSSVCMICAS